MPKLYELTGEYLQLVQNLESQETDAPMTDVIKLALSSVTEQIEGKVENIGKVISNIDSEYTGIQNEITRLTVRANSLAKQKDGLKQYLLTEMIALNTDKIKTTLFTFSVRANPVSVNVLNKEAVPVEFRRVIPETWEVDKKGIIENFKQTGEIPEGCEMVTEKKSLMIK